MNTEREYFVRGLIRLGVGLAILASSLGMLNIIGYVSWKYDVMIFTSRYNYPQYDSYMVRVIMLSLLGLAQTLICAFGLVMAGMLCIGAYRATSWTFTAAYQGILYLGGYRPIK
ncbi:hypothetical protein ACYSUW_15160 [Pseudomonas frederiksbergensis]